jgi:hypothetical protein
MSTEVTVAPSSILQGDFANALVQFSATTEENVEISYSHSNFLGYRLKSADGVLILEFPNREFGSPSGFVIRPGWGLRSSVNVPTRRPSVETAYNFVTWLSEEEILPPGEYTLEAGLYEMEGRYRWGKATFTVLGPVATRHVGARAF